MAVKVGVTTAGAALAAVEFREAPVHQCRADLKMLPQFIKATTENVQHARHVVSGDAASVEKMFNAEAKI